MESLKIDNAEVIPAIANQNFIMQNESAERRIYQRLGSPASKRLLVNSIREMETNLLTHGISFEGRALPVSVTPTVIPRNEIESVSSAARKIRRVLNRMLACFIREHNSRCYDGPFHRFFTPYYKWWDVIAAEKRASEHIQLMRYDAVRSEDCGWSFIETNTACPGGTIHCARIRDAWLSSELARQIVADEKLSSFPVDDATGFVKFLDAKARLINATQPNIAILNFRGTYTNELSSLQRCHAKLRSDGIFPNGELLLGDLREVTCEKGTTFLHGKPIALIYNKVDQLQIDPNNPEVAGWIEASRCEGTEFLNSLGSLYLAETKRSLALLSDPNWRSHLRLTSGELRVIDEFVPFTRLIEDCVTDVRFYDSILSHQKDLFVLKADALTRGSGIVLGDQSTREQWESGLINTREYNGIAQRKCVIPNRSTFRVVDDEVSEVTEYFGIDVFLFGDHFAGLVSRSHVNQVFNIGNGGREAPVLIVGDRE